MSNFMEEHGIISVIKRKGEIKLNNHSSKSKKIESKKRTKTKVTPESHKDTAAKADHQSEKVSVRENIIYNYTNLEKSIVEQLKMYHLKHGGVTGVLREDIWLELFQLIVPKKFVIEHSVFIIDSNDNLSREVDIAIVDQAYTPYIFQYGRLKYIPIEAVAAVVECKSQTANQENLEPWIKAIKDLKTSSEAIVRLATGMIINGRQVSAKVKALDDEAPKVVQSTQITDTGGIKQSAPRFDMQTSTRPIRIFCGYNTDLNKENRKYIEDNFDFVLVAGQKEKKNKKTNDKEKGKNEEERNEKERNGEENKIEVYVNENTYSDLLGWYLELNHYQNIDGAIESYYNTDQAKGAVGEHKSRVSIAGLEKVKLDDYRVSSDGEDISLLSFNFMLNQLLMLINNPMFFPHRAYVKLFNKKVQECDEEGGGYT